MITVLMATCQGKQYLEQQLDSILAQTVPVRILVSDDGSDDGTRELLLQYREWYPKQVFLHHRPAGAVASRSIPPAAQNFFWLLSLAAADEDNKYILLSDQDDVWFNHKVRCLMRNMKQLEGRLGKEHPILLHSDMEVVDETLEPIAPSFFNYQKCDPARNMLAEVLVENPVTGGALMMNRALLEKLVGNQDAESRDAERRDAESRDAGNRIAGSLERCEWVPAACCMHDWWIALVAACFGTIRCVPEPLYQYRQHGHNTLGAKATGSAADIKDRLRRQQQVRDNYRNMMEQAQAFLRRYGVEMEDENRAAVQAFLSLPIQSPLGRLQSIRRNHLYKSSGLQTIALCFTMPDLREREAAPKVESRAELKKESKEKSETESMQESEETTS